MHIEEMWRKNHQAEQKQVLWLVDPDKLSPPDFLRQVERYAAAGGKYVLIGGSFLTAVEMHTWLEKVHPTSPLPLVLFPGHASHISPHVDAILFLVLLSGRNPEYLISQQLHAAPALHRWGIEVIPTSYILVEGGNWTAAHYMSQSLPLPRHKPELAAAVALAGRFMGHRVTYIDAGSGASEPPPEELISAIRKVVEGPILVGGGYRTPQAVMQAWKAGADFVVIGSEIEKNPSFWDTLRTYAQMGTY